MAMLKSVVIVACAAFVVSQNCGIEIETIAGLTADLASFDLKLDVRTWSEYIGDGDETCNSGNDPRKCDYGHHSAFPFLNNPDRTDRASIWREDGDYVLAQSLADALGRCYGDAAATTKVVISCHSGGRSRFVMQQLENAGFACANLYNFAPGARGLFQAWESGGSITGDALEMHRIDTSPGNFDWTSCPAGDPYAVDTGSGDGVSSGPASGDSSSAVVLGKFMNLAQVVAVAVPLHFL